MFRDDAFDWINEQHWWLESCFIVVLRPKARIAQKHQKHNFGLKFFVGNLVGFLKYVLSCLISIEA